MKLTNVFYSLTLCAIVFAAQENYAAQKLSKDESLMNDERVALVQATAEVQALEEKTSSTMDDALAHLINGDIDATEFATIVREQNALVAQAKQKLKSMVQEATEIVAESDIEQGYINYMLSGAADLAGRAAAPFKAGYGYTDQEKEVARQMIAGLQLQLERIEQKYEQAMQDVLTDQERTRLDEERADVLQKLNRDIYEQQLITGEKGMSTGQKLLLGAIVAGGAVAGMAFAQEYLKSAAEAMPEAIPLTTPESEVVFPGPKESNIIDIEPLVEQPIKVEQTVAVSGPVQEPIFASNMPEEKSNELSDGMPNEIPIMEMPEKDSAQEEILDEMPEQKGSSWRDFVFGDAPSKFQKDEAKRLAEIEAEKATAEIAAAPELDNSDVVETASDIMMGNPVLQTTPEKISDVVVEEPVVTDMELAPENVSIVETEPVNADVVSQPIQENESAEIEVAEFPEYVEDQPYWSSITAGDESIPAPKKRVRSEDKNAEIQKLITQKREQKALKADVESAHQDRLAKSAKLQKLERELKGSQNAVVPVWITGKRSMDVIQQEVDDARNAVELAQAKEEDKMEQFNDLSAQIEEKSWMRRAKADVGVYTQERRERKQHLNEMKEEQKKVAAQVDQLSKEYIELNDRSKELIEERQRATDTKNAGKKSWFSRKPAPRDVRDIDADMTKIQRELEVVRESETQNKERLSDINAEIKASSWW